MPALRHVDTATLRIGYLESGAPDGPPAILLHGWPDDASTWHAVRAQLDAEGHRVITPYLRGFGPTTALNGEPPCGQLAVMATDVIALADALGIARFVLAGHDWGARITYLTAALFPERVRSAVAIAVGYGNAPGDTGLSLAQAQNYWYQWYMATPMGQAALVRDRVAFTRFLWSAWAPGWVPAEGEFEAAASSFDNDQWLAVTLHSYRHRWGLADGLPRYAALERSVSPPPRIAVPTLVLHGADDPCNAPATSAHREQNFTAPYERVLLDGVGHFPQREVPQQVAAHLLRWWRETSR